MNLSAVEPPRSLAEAREKKRVAEDEEAKFEEAQASEEASLDLPLELDEPEKDFTPILDFLKRHKKRKKGASQRDRMLAAYSQVDKSHPEIDDRGSQINLKV